MRLPIDPLPRPTALPPRDPFAIFRKPPIARAPRADEEALAQTARPKTTPSREHSDADARPHAEQRNADPYPFGDRRRYCRRVLDQPVILDTRSGEDRRHQGRRATDPSPGIDEMV